MASVKSPVRVRPPSREEALLHSTSKSKALSDNVAASSVVNVKSYIIPEGGVGAVVIREADLSVSANVTSSANVIKNANVNVTGNVNVIKNTNVNVSVNVKSGAYYFMS